MGGLRSQGQWPWRGEEGLLQAGAGEEGSAQSRPGFALQASGRRSPESCSKPEKILKRGTYDKVVGLDWAGGGGDPRAGCAPPSGASAVPRPSLAQACVHLPLPRSQDGWAQGQGRVGLSSREGLRPPLSACLPPPGLHG